MASKNAFYAQSGGVTAVINATACGVIETARKHKNGIGKIYAGRDGIIGALRSRRLHELRTVHHRRFPQGRNVCGHNLLLQRLRSRLKTCVPRSARAAGAIVIASETYRAIVSRFTQRRTTQVT